MPCCSSVCLAGAHRSWCSESHMAFPNSSAVSQSPKLCLQLPHLPGTIYKQVFVHLTPTGCSRIKILTGTLKIQPWGHPCWRCLARGWLGSTGPKPWQLHTQPVQLFWNLHLPNNSMRGKNGSGTTFNVCRFPRLSSTVKNIYVIKKAVPLVIDRSSADPSLFSTEKTIT